jgi:AraC-like DNA-binding protein
MHLLEITLDGQGRGSAGAWRGTLGPGTLLAVPAGTPYLLRTAERTHWTTAWALLEPRKWREFPPTVQLADSATAGALSTLLRLMDGERLGDDAASTLLRRSLTESLVLLLRRVVREAGALQDPHRATLLALFDEVSRRPAEPWSSERLARLAGCSRSQLHRRCVDAFGRAPAEQVQWIRMQQAEYWLSTTRLPLKTVAEQLGYRNPFHFSTAFKRWSGVAPAHYRARGTAASPLHTSRAGDGR